MVLNPLPCSLNPKRDPREARLSEPPHRPAGPFPCDAPLLGGAGRADEKPCGLAGEALGFRVEGLRA